MENEKTFRTTSGYCHILPGKIVLTRDGVIGKITKVITGNNMSVILIFQSLFTVYLFYYIYRNYQKGETALVVLFGFLGCIWVYNILNSLNNSATPEIDRKKIREVKFKKAIPGLTRSRFEVFFENDNGRIKKRLIMLPGSLASAKTDREETKKAVQIMTEENLLIV